MLQMTIPSMSCGHCVKSITETVQQLDANALVTADTTSKQVSVDASVPDEAVILALTEAGYPPA
ncbi:copper chaperone [Gammaproteobacteria bacterium LSUCC0112]|nr:copper chaperone [Gammaproteobacteria bacterium LSUCC0112]